MGTTDRPSTYIPPLAVSRMIGAYHFEGQGYVAIVADGQVPTEMLIEKAQALLDLKREELAAQAIEARRAATAKTGAVEDESAVAESDAPNFPVLNQDSSNG